MSEYYFGITVGPIVDTMANSSAPGALWFASFLFSSITRDILKGICEDDSNDVFNVRKQNGQYDKAFYDEKYKKGVGVYHDRIYGLRNDESTENVAAYVERVINDCINSQAEIISRVLEEKVDDITVYLKEYLNIHYIILKADEDNQKTVAQKLSDSLDALENMVNIAYCPQKDYILTLMEGKRGNNDYIRRYIEANEGVTAEEIAKADGAGMVSFKDSVNWTIKTIANIASAGEITAVDENKVSEQLEQLSKTCKYYAIVAADGDNMGQLLTKKCKDEELTAARQRERVTAFSNLCTDYSDMAVAKIRAYGGVVIYAGGDDLLFIAPVCNSNSNIWKLCKEISEEFKALSDGWIEKEKLTFEEGDVRPSISFGVSINYYKFPIYEALADAQGLLFGTAKHYGTKNNCAINVNKSSGQNQGFVCCMESNSTSKAGIYDAFLSLVDYMQSSKMPGNEDMLLHSVTYQIESRKGMLNAISDADIDEYLTNFFVNVFEYKAYKAQLDIVLDMYKMIARNSGQNVIRNVNSTQDSVADSVVSILRVAKFIVEGGK